VRDSVGIPEPAAAAESAAAEAGRRLEAAAIDDVPADPLLEAGGALDAAEASRAVGERATPASGEGDSVSEATAAAQTETSSDVQVTVRNMEPEDGRDVLDGYGLHPFRQAQVKVKWHDIMDAY
jgi:hypothetical protein